MMSFHSILFSKSLDKAAFVETAENSVIDHLFHFQFFNTRIA